MQAISRSTLAVMILLPASFIASRGRSQQNAVNEQSRTDIARGCYLVEEVAKCSECHTPRNARGELDRQAWLQGAPIWIMPVKPIRNWADRAPTLAGLPGMREEEVERVLEKGVGLEGDALRPPMHIYHMNPEDAKAIIAYLNSLPRPGQ